MSGNPIRFGLGSLFVVMALVCAVSAIASSSYMPFPILFGITMSVPTVLLVLIVWGERYQRAFSIGALVPTGVVLLVLMASAVNNALSNQQSLWEAAWPDLWVLVESWGFGILSGGLACLTLWLIERDRR